jgi:hypothetical protein
MLSIIGQVSLLKLGRVSGSAAPDFDRKEPYAEFSHGQTASDVLQPSGSQMHVPAFM